MQTITKIVKVAILLVVVTLIINSTYIARADAPLMNAKQQHDAHVYVWLDRLEAAESQDNPKLNFLDVNGQYSRGCLQFQDWTWEHYSKEFGIEGSQFDCDAERQVALNMVESDYSLWSSWWTSVVKKGVGKPPTT